jgi:hypothetical protein
VDLEIAATPTIPTCDFLPIGYRPRWIQIITANGELALTNEVHHLKIPT